jgi:sarcosine oxidase subunit gamma
MSEFGFINLRGDAGKRELATAVSSVLEQDLPVIANTLSNGKHRIYWLGPDEWLIVTSADDTVELLRRLRQSLAKQHAAVTDVSGGYVLFRLSGEDARDTLAMGSTLDFHPNAFQAGRCAQTGLAKSAVLIGQIDDEPTYEIIVRRSFASYLLTWLQAAAKGREIFV